MNALHVWSSLDQIGFTTMRVLLAALWQSSILLAAIGILTWLLRKRRPSVRHALWVGGLLLGPMLPLFAAIVLRTGAPQAPVRILPTYTEPASLSVQPMEPIVSVPPLEPAVPMAEPSEGAPEAQTRVSVLAYPWALLVIAYAGGFAAFLIWIALGRIRIRRWIRSAAPLVDERVLSIFRAAKRKIGFRRDFLVMEGDRTPTSVSFGVFHPLVLLPKGLTERLSDAELQALAIHELAHLKRNDSLVLLLVSLVRAALFFHPLVWLATRQISVLCEQVADDAVLDATGEAIAYAKMLARLAEDLPRRALSTEMAAGILFSKGAFLHRVQAILSDRRDQIRKLTRLALAGTVIAAVVSVGLALALPLGEKSFEPEQPKESPAEIAPQPAVAENAPSLRWVDVETGDVLFTGADIVRFDWKKQLFELRRERAIDLVMLRPALRRDFVVEDGRGTVYRGCFMSVASSSSYDGPTIRSGPTIPSMAPTRPPLYAIRGGYPSGGGTRDKDRFNPRLRAALEAAGVLKEIDPSEAPTPIQTSFSGWHGDRHGLKIAVTLFPETFRIGREARFALHIDKGETFSLNLDSLVLGVTLEGNEGRFFLTRSIGIPLAVREVGLYPYHGMHWGPTYGSPDIEARPGPGALKVVLRARRKTDGGSRSVATWQVPAQAVEILPPALKEQHPEDAAWGEAVEGLQMSIQPTKASYKAGESPEFYAALRNVGEADLTLNLGVMLANGKKQYPTEIRLLLTDSSGMRRELHVGSPRVAGRMDDFIVSLAAGACHSLRVRLKDYSNPDTKGFPIKLAEGQYQIAALYEGKGPKAVNSDMESVRHMQFWTDEVTSNTTTFTIGGKETGRIGEVEAVPTASAWGKGANGLQMSIAPAEHAPGKALAFDVAFRNAGKKDFVLNLGMTSANGKHLFPTALRLILADVEGKTRERPYSLPPHASGRVDDYVVALRAGSTHTIRVHSYQYSSLRKLSPAKYSIVAKFEGKGAQFIHEDTRGVGLLNFWKGTVRSGVLAFEIPQPAGGEQAWGEAVKNELAWAEVSNGLQCRLLPLEQAVEVAEGVKPEDVEVYVTYELRNVGEKAVKTRGIWGAFAWLFDVTGPDGQKLTYRGRRPSVRLPPAQDWLTITPGKTLARRVRLRYDFTEPGQYQICRISVVRPLPGIAGDWAEWEKIWSGTLKSNTVTLHVVRPKEPAWGEAVDGVQVRLRADKKVWDVGETPSFSLDVRNHGENVLTFAPIMESHCEIEYDGKWHRWGDPIRRIFGALRNIHPGEEHRDVFTDTLVPSWAEKNGRKRLQLTPGKHTVRVAFKPDGRDAPRTVSNPIEIEILPVRAQPTGSTPEPAERGKEQSQSAGKARSAEQATPEPYAWQRTDRYVPPDAENFFPDDPEGGHQLDRLFQAVDKDRRSDDEILSAVRRGFRRTTQHRTLILRWIGNRYIWGKQPQHPRAIEIMYHAVTMERHYAVYFGLSVVRPKTPNILRTLADICMQGEDVGRITWGVGSQRDELVSHIEPYMEHEDAEKRETASLLLKHFRGELDFAQVKGQEALAKKRAEFGDQLPELRQQLLTSDSESRLAALKLTQRHGLSALMDDSFLKAMSACAQDPDHRVRREVARIAGGRWIWGNKEQPLEAIRLMLQLSGDEDRDIRYQAVYFGLSTVREKTEDVLRRLTEIALSDHESNMYGRIVWGLRTSVRTDSKLLEQVLEQHLGKSESDSRRMAAIYFLHKDLFKTAPPRSWGLEEAAAEYPEDVFGLSFSAKEPFQPESADALWGEFRKNLPDGIEPQRVWTRKTQHNFVIVVRIRGAEERDAVKEMIERNPRLLFGDVTPLPPQMQLHLEERILGQGRRQPEPSKD